MVSAVDALAMAIFAFETGRLSSPQVRALRNNNPGNLRPLAAGQDVDSGDYRVFSSFAAGWLALTEDVEYKLTVHLKAEQTLLDFFNLYAPGADHNDPLSYAQFVCRWLSGALGGDLYTPGTPIGRLLNL